MSQKLDKDALFEAKFQQIEAALAAALKQLWSDHEAKVAERLAQNPVADIDDLVEANEEATNLLDESSDKAVAELYKEIYGKEFQSKILEILKEYNDGVKPLKAALKVAYKPLKADYKAKLAKRRAQDPNADISDLYWWYKEKRAEIESKVYRKKERVLRKKRQAKLARAYTELDKGTSKQ
ncbi:hypothetical protein [Ktedonospora formicarum]|uniref:Uncharacterized protein n=1 Tax=Ktedonospora formicarum TaxID=2778364 RepID=A0A8J3MYH2_9CHLR|nr:hypothetical protein [Ktedonospora formicarum]GHO50951.1 hypothetical protein KSX_91140 [Ktedonospora formicarum]